MFIQDFIPAKKNTSTSLKAIGSKFYGMTQSELSKATGIKTGGTLTKLLDNLRENQELQREYPRYGKGKSRNHISAKRFLFLYSI